MKVALILGTRPEIIKMAPVISALRQKRVSSFLVHSGQHYSYDLDRMFFKGLGLPAAKYNLEVGSGSHAGQTAGILKGVEEVLELESPDTVLVEGDTNTVLAAVLAATKLGIKVGHIEAGLRSYDRTMPEETNRVLTDHAADLLFAPTEQARQTLLGEGIAPERVFVTGNTIVDAVCQVRAERELKPNSNGRDNLKAGGYFLATVHRQENVDNRDRFTSILRGLDKVAANFGMSVVYPAHPRARKMMEQFGLEPERVRLMEPVDYASFIELEEAARLVLTDSGGVQEEACILGVPCVTLRDNTERPETIVVGANILAGVQPEKIVQACQIMLKRSNDWKNPFGDGKAGQRIVDILTEVADD